MQYCYQAPFGTLLCRLHNGLPAEILLQHSPAPFLPALPNDTPLAQWLDSYFSGSPVPLPLLIPCHRVRSANGLGGFSMGGDAERSLAVKRWLLAHEGVAW